MRAVLAILMLPGCFWGPCAFPPSVEPAPGAAGPFVQVVVGEGQACGLQADGSVVCWGDQASGGPRDVTRIAASRSAAGGRPSGGRVCGLDADGAIVCGAGNEVALDGPLVDLAHHRRGRVRPHPGWGFCAIDAGGPRCTDALVDGDGGEPPVQIALTTSNSEDQVRCLRFADGSTNCRLGDVVDIAMSRFSVGITSAGRWVSGVGSDWETDVFAGEYAAIDADQGVVCALRTDGDVDCGSLSWPGGGCE